MFEALRFSESFCQAIGSNDSEFRKASFLQNPSCFRHRPRVDAANQLALALRNVTRKGARGTKAVSARSVPLRRKRETGRRRVRSALKFVLNEFDTLYTAAYSVEV